MSTSGWCTSRRASLGSLPCQVDMCPGAGGTRAGMCGSAYLGTFYVGSLRMARVLSWDRSIPSPSSYLEEWCFPPGFCHIPSETCLLGGCSQLRYLMQEGRDFYPGRLMRRLRDHKSHRFGHLLWLG